MTTDSTEIKVANQDRYQVHERDVIIDRTRVEVATWPPNEASQRWSALNLAVQMLAAGAFGKDQTPEDYFAAADQVLGWVRAT